MVEPWRNCKGKERVYTWGHVREQNKAAVKVEPKKEEVKRVIPERRIDYIFINKREQNICVESEILEQGEIGWNTDHKATKVRLLGLAAIRRTMGNTWQRRTYNMKKFKGVVADRVEKECEEWVRVGLAGKDKLNWLTKRMQKALKKEVGRRDQWRPIPRSIPKSEAIEACKKEMDRVKYMLGKGGENKENMICWMRAEIARCKGINKGVSTAERMTREREEDEGQNIEIIKWTLLRRWSALKGVLRKEEESALRYK